MSKNTIISVIVIVLLLGGYLLFSRGSYQGAPQVQAPTNQNKNVVVLTDAGYAPQTLTIGKGDSVLFKNESTKSMWTASAMHPAHAAYSGTTLDQHCPDAANASFDACKGYLPNQEWSFRFDKVGTWKYHNHLDPKAWGTIIVK